MSHDWSDKIEPALTGDEWAEGALSKRGKTSPRFEASLDSDDGHVIVEGAWVEPDERHALAALCLYGQPFGFTHEDVAFLLGLEGGEWDRLGRDEYAEMAAQLRAIASRLAALLPPEP